MKTKKRPLRRLLRLVLWLCILGIVFVTAANLAVVKTTDDRILAPEEAATLQDIDCILVLGCFVQGDGTPSHMLHDRLNQGMELYHMGAAPKLLMSGDHGQRNYDEVTAMKQFAVDRGAPSTDVFMDHAGFSTYESIYRARDVFKVKKILIVTQEYHLYRALYIAKRLGVEAYGVASDYRTYSGQTSRDVRELLARTKDFAICIYKPLPTFLGEAIPISGDGNLTNDGKSDFS